MQIIYDASWIQKSVRNALYLKCITWNSSKERWELPPVTQTGTCGIITHLSHVKIETIVIIYLSKLH
jgi:hypothetical protein